MLRSRRRLSRAPWSYVLGLLPFRRRGYLPTFRVQDRFANAQFCMESLREREESGNLYGKLICVYRFVREAPLSRGKQSTDVRKDPT